MNEHKSSIGRFISLLYRYGQMFAGEQLKRHGVGKGQYVFLNALYRKDGINQEAISDYLRMDKGTTAKAIKKLESEGYVRRSVSAGDKRSNEIYLTDKGRQLEPEIRSVYMEWRGILTEGFSAEEKELAHSLLERMGQNAAAYMNRSAPPFSGEGDRS
jgi:DNA-binding MarR family transcriptional regulator